MAKAQTFYDYKGLAMHTLYDFGHSVIFECCMA